MDTEEDEEKQDGEEKIVYNKGKGRDKIVSKAAVTKCYSWVSEEK